MLREVKVNGFRSLLGFRTEFQPGLNVIVGPNGTGKSNFISFLDFLSALFSSGLNAAIASAQGAGSVFSQESFSDDSASLTFMLLGNSSYVYDDDHARRMSGVVEYEYTCSITYLRSVPAVFVDYEYLTASAENFDEPLHIERRTHRDSKSFSTNVVISPKNHTAAGNFFPWRREEDGETVSSYLASITGGDFSILNRLIHAHPSLAAITRDVSRYKSINIDPALARKPSPVGTTAEISANGDGLAGALYRMERGTYHPLNMLTLWMANHRDADQQKSDYKQIMSWCREVNADISQARVHLDFHEALLRPVMEYNYNGRKAEFPFRRVSDGTVKWLALVTILVAENNLSVIEEPENFLHPFMQEAFVALCRQVISADPDRAIIVSTHSPTLLDCCSPQELTIFENVEGRTVSSRVANRDELAAVIAKSRFGLGYYYKTGGVYGEDRSLS